MQTLIFLMYIGRSNKNGNQKIFNSRKLMGESIIKFGANNAMMQN